MIAGEDIESFHAAEDSQKVRDQVFSFVGDLKDISIDSVVVQKNKAYPYLYMEKSGNKVKYKGEEVYKIALQSLLEHIFKQQQYEEKNLEKIIIILSSIFNRKKHDLILKTIKKYLKTKFQIPFFVYFHSSKSDINCQIADYCSWAIYRKWTDGEERPYKSISHIVKSEFDIFRVGNKEFYEYKI